MDFLTEQAMKAYYGDEKALEYVAEKSFKIAFSLSMRILKQREDAEDIAQEVTAKSCHLLRTKHPSAFKYQEPSGAEYRTWMYRTSYNKIMNHIKTKKRRKELSIEELLFKEIPLIDSIPAKVRSPEQEMIDKEIYDAVIYACTKMSINYLIEFILRDLEGMSYEEIAEVRGLSIGTVRSRIHRGRAEVKAYLRRFYKSSIPILST